MNTHIEAWNHVKPHLFGDVCEIARKTPWGFREDNKSIHNVTIDQFLASKDTFDTIILHILSGEGEPMDRILKVLESVYLRSVKVIILEHNPDSKDFKDLAQLDPIKDFIEDKKERYIYEDWGRNLLYAFTTMSPFHLPELNDKVAQDTSKYYKPGRAGMDPVNNIYILTSESPIDFDLPDGTIYWVIGGGLAYESIQEKNKNILIDSCLSQCIYAALKYGVDNRKLSRLRNLNDIDLYRGWEQWRYAEMNGVIPDSIRYISLDKLKVKNCTVYISTVPKKIWKHLIKDNHIIDALTERDLPRLVLKK